MEREHSTNERLLRDANIRLGIEQGKNLHPRTAISDARTSRSLRRNAMTLKQPRIILISGVISLTVLITCIVWTKLPSGNNQQQVDTVIELPTQTVEEVLASRSPRVARYIRDTSNHGKSEKAPSNNHRTRGGKTETHAPHTVFLMHKV